MSDGIDTVLRLVSEGRLTAEEAGPILDALDAEAGGTARPAASDARSQAPATPPGEGGPSAVRIEVREGGRQVVNLRLPLALGRFAMDRVPGLSGQQADRIREALQHGVRGPIIEVDEADGNGVRIILE
jgi:hypothetical protein